MLVMCKAENKALSALLRLLTHFHYLSHDSLYMCVLYRLQTVDAFEFKPNRVREDVIVRDALRGESFASLEQTPHTK